MPVSQDRANKPHSAPEPKRAYQSPKIVEEVLLTTISLECLDKRNEPQT